MTDRVAPLASPDMLEAYYTNIQRSETILMAALGLEGNVVTCNRALASLLGTTPEQTHGIPFDTFLAAHDRATARQAFTRFVTQGAPNQYEVTLLDGRGIGHRLLWSASIMNSGDRPSGVLLFGIDITEKELRQQKLIESEQILRRAEETAHVGSYVLDVCTGIWTSSPVLDDLFGINELFSRTVEGWESLIHPDDRVRMSTYFQDTVLGKKQRFDTIYRIVRFSDRAIRWVHGLGTLDINEQGVIERMVGTIQDITDQHDLLTKLSESELRYRNAAELTGHILYDWDVRSGSITWAGAIEEVTGYTPKEFASVDITRWEQLIHPDDRAQATEALDRARRTQARYDTIYRFRQKNGTYLRMHDIGSFIRDASGELSHMLGVQRDATAREEAVMKLRQDERELQYLFEGMQNGFAEHEVILDSKGVVVDYRFLRVNPAYERITGLKASEITGKTVRTIMPSIEQFWIETYGNVALTGAPTRFRQFNGATAKYYDVFAYSPSRNRFAVIVEDVTEEEHTRAEQQSSLEHIQLIIDSIPDPVYVKDQQGVFHAVNQALCDLFKIPKSSLIGMNQAALPVPPSLIQSYIAHDREVLETDTRKVFEEVIKKPDGEEEVFQSIRTPFQYPSGERMVLGISHDVTTYRKAIIEARAQKELAQIALDNAVSLVTILDGDGIIRYTGNSCLPIIGFTPSELIGKSVFDFAHPDDKASVQRDYRIALANPRQRIVTTARFLHKDGSWRWLEIMGTMLPSSSPIKGRIEFARDVTEAHEHQQYSHDMESRFQLAMQQTGQLIYDWNVLTDELHFDGAIQEVTGSSPSQLQKIPLKKWMSMIIPEDSARTLAALEQAKKEHRRFQATYRLQRHDGSVITVENRGAFLYDARNVAHRMLGAMQDISSVILDRTEAVANAEITKAIMENALDFITILSADGTITFEASSNENFLGYRAGENIGKNIMSFIHPDDRAKVMKAIVAGSKTDVRQRVRYRSRRKDGSYAIMESIGRVMFDNPHVRGILTQSRDVSAEQELQENAAEQKQLETMNKAMVGRELRIMELKRTVRQLQLELAQLKGVPPPDEPL